MGVFYDPVLGQLRTKDLSKKDKGLIENAIQPVTTMPNANAAAAGKVYLYTGQTSESYKHGHFYQCLEDDGYYYWQDCQVGAVGVGNVSNIRCVAQGSTVRLKIKDAEDTVVGGVVIAKWAGCKWVRKQGSYPTGPDDGTLILNCTTRNQYNNTAFVDTVTEGVTYYYQFFPYTDEGVVTIDDANRVETSEITWGTVADLVLTGDAQTIFSAGDILTVAHSTYGEIQMEIMGFDDHIPVALRYANADSAVYVHSQDTIGVGTSVYQQRSMENVKGTISAITGSTDVGTSHYNISVPEKITVDGVVYELQAHSMSLLSRKVIASLNWDAAEKAYALTEDETFQSGKTYYTKSGDVYTEASVTEGEAVTPNTYYEANPHANRVSYGYNNWEESAIRQWLNSDDAAGQWWSAKNIWDNAPSYATSTAGFLNGITEPGFVNAVGPVYLKTAKNTVTDGGGSRITSDRFFLPSSTEVFGSATNNIYEGDQFAFFVGTDANGKIKHNSANTASGWWLRSPNASGASNVCNVYTTGTLSNGNASNAHGCAPACVIC